MDELLYSSGVQQPMPPNAAASGRCNPSHLDATKSDRIAANPSVRVNGCRRWLAHRRLKIINYRSGTTEREKRCQTSTDYDTTPSLLRHPTYSILMASTARRRMGVQIPRTVVAPDSGR